VTVLPAGDENAFARNQSLRDSLQGPHGARCDNRAGNAPICCRLTSAVAVKQARALRCRSNVPGFTIGKNIADNVDIVHLFLPDGRLQIRFYPEALPVGNFPVQLKIASGTSSYTTVEFILHLMLDSQVEAFLPPGAEEVYEQKVAPVGFPMHLRWQADEVKSKFTYLLFDNMHEHTFGLTSPVSSFRGHGSGTLSWEVEWVSAPCLESVGMYFYCLHGLIASPPYDWQSIQCKLVRIVEDLPPVLSFFEVVEDCLCTMGIACMVHDVLAWRYVQAFSCTLKKLNSGYHNWETLLCACICPFTRTHNVNTCHQHDDILRPNYRNLQASHFSVFMGQRLEVVAQARDNPSDSIDFLKLSKVCIPAYIRVSCAQACIKCTAHLYLCHLIGVTICIQNHRRSISTRGIACEHPYTWSPRRSET
jgi:hypothetical protein